MATRLQSRWDSISRILARGMVSLMLVAAVLAGLSAILEFSSSTRDGSGNVCGSAWHFHPGSASRIQGGEQSVDARAEKSDECRRDGAAAWRRGRILGGCAVALLVADVGLEVVLRFRRGLQQECRSPSTGPGTTPSS